MLVRTSAPAAEPILLAEARLHLRLRDSDGTDEDSLITRYIVAAREYAEVEMGRSLITQTWRQVLDCFPLDGRLLLERGPVQSISSVTYRDMSSTTQTVSFAAASNSIQRATDGSLVADLSGAPAVLAPAFGYTWPVAMPEIGAVAVTYTAGYGASGASVPEEIRSWMLLRIATAFENREELVDGRLAALPYLDSMLHHHAVVLA